MWLEIDGDYFVYSLYIIEYWRSVVSELVFMSLLEVEVFCVWFGGWVMIELEYYLIFVSKEGERVKKL